MKKQNNFWQGVGKYMLARAWLVGLVGAGIVMVMSLLDRGGSLVRASDWEMGVEMAARAGDYETARKIMDQSTNEPVNQSVLGVNSDLVDLVYPERKVEREIARYEELNKKYPGSRDILLGLNKLENELGNEDVAEKYWEEARELDPNNPIFTNNQ